MKVSYDYSKDIMFIDGVDFPLRPYRRWLIEFHESLCTGHFIKAIRSFDKIKYTYDWDTIYFKAAQYEFLNQYLKTI